MGKRLKSGNNCGYHFEMKTQMRQANIILRNVQRWTYGAEQGAPHARTWRTQLLTDNGQRKIIAARTGKSMQHFCYRQLQRNAMQWTEWLSECEMWNVQRNLRLACACRFILLYTAAFFHVFFTHLVFPLRPLFEASIWQLQMQTFSQINFAHYECKMRRTNKQGTIYNTLGRCLNWEKRNNIRFLQPQLPRPY